MSSDNIETFRPAVYMNDEQLIEHVIKIIRDAYWGTLADIAENITGREIMVDMDRDGAWMFLDPELDKVEDYYPKVHNVAWDFEKQQYIDGGVINVKKI